MTDNGRQQSQDVCLWYSPLMSSQQAEKEKKARLPKPFDTQIQSQASLSEQKTASLKGTHFFIESAEASAKDRWSVL